MSDIVDTVKMPDQDGKSPGDLWYGLPINPTLATHVWNGREWRPLLTEEDYYRAEITALRAENERLRAALVWIDSQRYTDRSTINQDNAFEKAVKLNSSLLAIMDRARAALEGRT